LQLLMLWSFVACLLLLPLLWGCAPAATAAAPADPRAATAARLLACLQGAAVAMFVPISCMLVLVPGGGLAALRAPVVLQFPSPQLEARYGSWLAAKLLGTDTCLHALVVLLATLCWARTRSLQQLEAGAPAAPAALGGAEGVAGQLVGALLRAAPLLGGLSHQQLAALGGALLAPLLPSASVLFLRWRSYIAHREALLLASRLCSTAALLWLHTACPQLLAGMVGLPALACLEALRALCLHSRLLSYLPSQALHTAVLGLLVTGGSWRLLPCLQLLAFGLCLPCLLVYSSEVLLRKAFLAGPWAQQGGGKGVAAASKAAQLPC
jgi:hypothetical protein